MSDYSDLWRVWKERHTKPHVMEVTVFEEEDTDDPVTPQAQCILCRTRMAPVATAEEGQRLANRIYDKALVQGREAWPGHAFCGGPKFTYHVVFFAVKYGKEELILHARGRENLLRQIKDSDRLNTIEEAIQITSAVWNL